jgi:hypothetical protein
MVDTELASFCVGPGYHSYSHYLFLCCRKITAYTAPIGYAGLALPNGGEMTHIGREHDKSFVRRMGRFAVSALMYALLPAALWSAISWAEEATPQEGKPYSLPQTEIKRLSRTPAAKPLPPKPAPIAAPVTHAMSGGTLATALASCDKRSQNSEPLTLPGAKGKIKLDRCYRGRDHLVCSFNALLTEAKALFSDYTKIVEIDYPNIDNIAAVCGIKPDDLAANLNNASTFEARFKILKNEYALRANCASKFEQSLRDANLPNMVRGTEILKSIIDSMQAEIKDVVAMQNQVVEFAEKVDASRKAMATIQEIHPTVCIRDQSVRRDVEQTGSPGQRSSETN